MYFLAGQVGGERDQKLIKICVAGSSPVRCTRRRFNHPMSAATAAPARTPPPATARTAAPRWAARTAP